MAEAKRYVALDLGAESGRAIAGAFDGGKMSLDVLHRFPTGPVRMLDTLYWDFPGFIRELKNGLSAYSAKYGPQLAGVACDSWGVDFGLLDRQGNLLGNPVHYRDSRTNGMPEKVFKLVPRRTLYQRTGIQVMQLNTIFQLYSMVLNKSPMLESAEKMLMIADLCAYFLTGEAAQEYTLATTAEIYDPTKGDWSRETIRELGIPEKIFPDVIAPGSVLGVLLGQVAADCGVEAAPVIAPASHDTASAVAAVPADNGRWLFISSGTWSLMGVELSAPIMNDLSAEKNFTNEGGVDGTIRYLKNIMGLWQVQECRRAWEKEGEPLDYATLTAMAEQAPPFQAFLNPNDNRFLAPGGMPGRIAEYFRDSGQSVPASKGGMVRCCLESLALEYRRVMETIQELTGQKYETLHIVGGGSQNRLLNQLAADATGLVVKAGPVEATAFGNCLMQAIALGDVGSLAQAREIVRRSVEIETYHPSGDRAHWNDAYERFKKI